MKSSPYSSSLCLLLGSSLLVAGVARAQVGFSPEAVPARDEAQGKAPTLVVPAPTATPIPTVPGVTPTPDATTGTPPMPAPDSTAAIPASSQLTAKRVAYEGGTIIAQGDEINPVIFRSGMGRLQATEVRLDTVAQTVNATGGVQLEREIVVSRRELRSNQLLPLSRQDRVTETAFGQNLTFNFKTQIGSLDKGVLRTSQVDFRADRLEINGQKYTARQAVIRPGGLSDEELKIYGTPPLNLRARVISVRRDARANRVSISAKGAGLYFKSTRILPLPSAVLRYGTGNNDSQFSVTPRVGYNSSDGLLVAGRFGVALARDPRQLSLDANLGISQRVGFRGGATLSSSQSWGDLRLSAQRLDVVQTQLTNKIELDRKPEITYRSPAFGVFAIPRVGRAGFSLDAGYGRFTERSRDDENPFGPVSSDRTQARLLFTTRLDPQAGPFLRAFAATSHYSRASTHYDATGVEFGYAGQLLQRVSGEVSLRLTDVSGQTPFRFDLIEIPRELRTTFDVEVTPRYVLPFDIRYDLDQSKVRDTTFGILRSYKVFAYGVVYQTARHDLRLEVRSGF
ncbi:hypothetical protein IAD21_02255 [Abditibacteriota bacterium]|nr:hypothetical protein IAD21_02255 [Abditibacteriota bacterium]